MSSRQRSVSGLEVLLIPAIIGVVLFLAIRAMVSPDTTTLSGRLLAPCASFPTLQEVTVEGAGGKELGSGMATSPVRIDSHRCWADYSAEVEQADQYRIVLGGEIRSALLPRVSTMAVTLSSSL